MAGLLGLCSALSMLAMPTMHEQVQERAQEQERVGQDAKEVGRMLGDEIKRRNAEKGQKDQARA